MELLEYGNAWIWHPDYIDTGRAPSRIVITADTRFKLYVNKRFVHGGPVKGDEKRWFYDTIDIAPFLQQGENHIAAHVLRFYHATTYAWTFARTPIGGLHIRSVDSSSETSQLNTDDTWKVAIDPCSNLRIDEPFDDFMNIFERVDKRKDSQLAWVNASIVRVAYEGTGLGMPWRLCPRMIPHQIQTPLSFNYLHNVRSTIPLEKWKALLLSSQPDAPSSIQELTLPGDTTHHLELGVENHKTALLNLRFATDPAAAGTEVTITYSECYEDEPNERPYARRKGNRTDTTKMLIGPQDLYTLSGGLETSPQYSIYAPGEEVYQPFHYRTFRYLAIDIHVPTGAQATFRGIEAIETRYPLDVKASFDTGDDWVSKLWSISIRTLENCMHDCYEDCPFYEQLQYSMDTRSSALFTYLVSGDDRLARQAIIQLHDSFNPSIGLLAGRSTDSIMQRQYIVPFTLYWVCMVVDHYEYYADAAFVRKFLGVADSVIETFASRVDDRHGLITSPNNAAWEYTDWATPWAKAPTGVPTAVARTGVSTYINCLYAYTLRHLATLLDHLGRGETALRHRCEADRIVEAVNAGCFDGQFYTDGLVQKPIPRNEYSQHSQVWAALSGAATGPLAVRVLTESLARGDPNSQKWMPASTYKESSLLNHAAQGQDLLFTKTSISFSFYTLRALAAIGPTAYDNHFDGFWDLWREQVAQNVTTWAEDAVSVRSDCHAWGSVPIYEFVTEVIGLRPGAPGWAKVMFQPRLRLFPRLKVRIPISAGPGLVIVKVEWESLGDGTVVRLQREGPQISDKDITIVARLPGRDETIIKLRDREGFIVRDGF